MHIETNRNRRRMNRANAAVNSAVMDSLENRQLLSASVSFGTPTNYSVGGGPDAMIVADVNGDGIKDVVTANYNGTISILLGQSTGKFKAAQTIPDGLTGGIAFLSFSSPDIIVGNDFGQVSVLVGNTSGGNNNSPGTLTGSFGAPSVITLANSDLTAVAIADVNGDGKPDLILGYSNGHVNVLQGNGGTTFANTPKSGFAFTVGSDAVTSLAVADFYYGGVPDIVVGDASGTVSLIAGNTTVTQTFAGTLSSPVALGAVAPSVLVNVVTGDLNDPGTLGFVATSYGATTALVFSNTSGTLVSSSVTTPGDVVNSAIGDVNGDGVPDLAAVDYSAGEVTILNGNTNGTFASSATAITGARPDAVQLVDVNGDGRADLITADYGTGQVSVLLNSSTVAPRITSVNHATMVAGVAGAFDVTSVGFPTGTIAKVSGTLPAGVTLGKSANGDAELEGTPSSTSGGVYVVTLQPSNTAGTGDIQVFTLTVDQSRKFTSKTVATFQTSTSGSFTITTSGFPSSAVTEIGALPTGVSFTSTGNGTATLSGTPGATTGGTYKILLVAGTGIGGGPSQTFTLTVDQPLAFTSATSAAFTEGTVGTAGITLTGFPLAKVTETGKLPGGIKLVSTGADTAELAGKPTSNGTFAIVLKATNTTTSTATQDFTLTVAQPVGLSHVNASSVSFGSTIIESGSIEVMMPIPENTLFMLPPVQELEGIQILGQGPVEPITSPIEGSGILTIAPIGTLTAPSPLQLVNGVLPVPADGSQTPDDFTGGDDAGAVLIIQGNVNPPS